VVVQEDAVLPYVAEESSRSAESPLTAIKNAQKILKTCLRSLTNIYVVIDGLDECRPGEKRTIVSWFTNLSSGLQDDGIKFRCIFSSQSDEETSKLFRGVPSIQVDGDGLFRDIRTFCKIECENIKTNFSLSDSEADLITEQVAKEAKCEWRLPYFASIPALLTVNSYVSLRQAGHAQSANPDQACRSEKRIRTRVLPQESK